MMLEDTYEGMFSDPIYGGNHAFAGWKLVGYPGAQRAYTPSELVHGPQHKRVQGLRDMAGMNPGVPQDHVILPMAGTRMDPNMDMGDK
jgi:gluconate 2-dehydrogenase gamma chain